MFPGSAEVWLFDGSDRICVKQPPSLMFVCFNSWLYKVGLSSLELLEKLNVEKTRSDQTYCTRSSKQNGFHVYHSAYFYPSFYCYYQCRITCEKDPYRVKFLCLSFTSFLLCCNFFNVEKKRPTNVYGVSLNNWRHDYCSLPAVISHSSPNLGTMLLCVGKGYAASDFFPCLTGITHPTGHC